MTTISRRSFIQGLAALPLVAAAPRTARAATTYVRYDCASPQGLQMLEIYADAVRRMKEMGPDNPLSWMWQWYSHFVTGSTSKADELVRIFGEGDSTTKALADTVWNTCQPHSGQNPNHFLPWHRMFVFYFERIVRQVSGRADFTLPYWDYTSTDPGKCGILPEQFRLPDDPLFGSLYVPNRSSLANSGQPIHSGQPTNPMDITDLMLKENYSSSGSVMGFCRYTDASIHGSIHVLVGDRRNMGSVPYSGGDPLFWVHHSNIDRIWASWNRNGGKNPSADWINNSFTLVDWNGQPVTRTARYFFSVLTRGYDYDAFIEKPVAPATTTTAMKTASANARAERVAAARGGVDLGARPVHVPLLPLAASKVRGPVLGLDDSGRRSYLVIKDLHTWSQPEVLFHVYVRAGNGAGNLDRSHHVGIINFFDAEFHDHGDTQKDMALGENFYSFDVTEVLDRIRRGGGNAARDKLLVTIAPAGAPTGGKPMVGTMELRLQ
jgi:hypothetical protein